MFSELTRMSWSALRHGHVHGLPVSRNPIAWIAPMLRLPLVFVLLLLLMVGHIFLLPLLLTLAYFRMRSFRRREGIVSEEGIHFQKAYGRLTIPWSEIREVVREHEPKLIFYRIGCGIAPEDDRDYILSTTPDNDAFERTLNERGIPFKTECWYRRAETTA